MCKIAPAQIKVNTPAFAPDDPRGMSCRGVLSNPPEHSNANEALPARKLILRRGVRTPEGVIAPLLDTCEHPAKTTHEPAKIAREGEKWAERSARKVQAEAFGDRVRRADSGWANKVGGCSSRYELWANGHTGEKFVRAFHCDDRFCPVCSHRRSARIFRKYSPVLKSLNERFYAHHLTLTFLSTDSLPDLKRIRQLRRNFFRRKFWKKYGVMGGMESFEVTWNPGKGWHPHLHVLLFTENPIESYEKDGFWTVEANQEVSAEWARTNDDGAYIVRGREVRDEGGLSEVAKYLTKSTDELPLAKLMELKKWSVGLRTFTTFGIVRDELQALGIDPDDEGEEVEEDSDVCAPVRECTCGHCPWELSEVSFDGRLKNYVLNGTVTLYDDPRKKKKPEGVK